MGAPIEPEPSPRPRDRRRAASALAVLAAALVVLAVVLTSGARSPRGHRLTAPTTPAVPTKPVTSTAPATIPVGPGPPAQPAPVGEQFGVNVNRLFDDRTYTPQQIDAQLQALRRTGATVARTDAQWEASEPAAPVDGVHHYAWAFDDEIAGSLAAHGLRWLPLIVYVAPWAQSIVGQDHSPPSSIIDYAAYAAAVAARYGPGGSFWRTHPHLAALPTNTYEIWNEPDNGEFWTPVPDASRYADLYIQARDAVTSVQPEARVIIGGLTRPTTFLPAMLAAAPQLRGHVDGVAVHPYGNPPVVLAKVRADREALTSLGMASVPLYVNEFGWTTQPVGALDWAPERLRPQFISRTLAALGHLDCGIAAVVLYTWVTPQEDPANSQDWYGIHAPDNSGATGTKGSVDTTAFTAGLKRATAPGATIPLCAPG